MGVAASTDRIDLDLISLGRDAVAALDGLYAAARAGVRAKVSKDGKISSALVDKEQRAAHGLAWLATYVESLREMIDYSERLTASGQFESYFGGYYTQFTGGNYSDFTKQAVTDCLNGVRNHEYQRFRGYETDGSVQIAGGNYYF